MRDIIIVGYMKNNNIYIYYKIMSTESGDSSPRSVISREEFGEDVKKF